MHYSNNTLNTLLEQLRARGIAVGTIELQRLQNVFAQAPSLSWLEFRELLCALLAKDMRQRRVVKRLFEQLVPYEPDQAKEENMQKKGGVGNTRKTQTVADKIADKDEENTLKLTKQKPPKKPIDVWKWGIALSMLLGLFILALYLYSHKPPPIAPVPPNPVPLKNQNKKHTEADHAKPIAIKTDLDLVKTLTLWKPEIIGIENKPIFSDSWPPLLMLLLSGLGFSWLWQQARLKTQKRQPQPISILKRGKSWLPPLQKQADFDLLSSKDRREMSWGISHYLSDQTLNKLDIPKSVSASAKTALPSLHFKSAQRQREVWLWQDKSSDNQNLSKLAAEITRTLQAVNIHLKIAYFHALPNKVISDHGEVIRSNHYENPDNQPLVVILSDYANLSRAGILESEQLKQTLQQLSHWQNLCMVDCSLHTGLLCRLLKPYSLDCIQPQDVASWLSQQGGVVNISQSECQLDDLHHWAIACALPERPLMESEIRALHEALALNCGWQYHQLTRYAQQSAHGLDFSQSRPQLLDEFSLLAKAKQNQADNPFINKAITFWLARNREIDSLLSKQETPDKPWKESNRQQRLKLDSALLQLWLSDKIEQAANTLYDLHQNKQEKYKLKQLVEAKLSHYCCQGYCQDQNTTTQAITLPHQWKALTPQTRHQLKAAGLGGKPQETNISWNKTSSLILSALLGLGLISAYKSYEAIKPLLMPEKPQLKQVSNSAKPDTKQIIIQQGKTSFFIGDRKGIGDGDGDGSSNTKLFVTADQLKDNQTLWLIWHKINAQAAQIKLKEYNNIEIWRLGENPKPPQNNQALTIAVIANKNKQKKVYKLAAKLLDSGTADQVIISKKTKDWQRYLQANSAFYANKKLKTQWIFINTDYNASNNATKDFSADQPAVWFKKEPAKLLNELNQNKQYSADELGGIQLGKNTNISLWGLKKEKTNNLNKLELLKGKSQITLIRIPRGSFQMGGHTYDPFTEDEKPVHQVSIDYDFYMSQNEITFNQYNAYVKATIIKEPDDEDWGRENRPAINVSWDDAQGFIKWLNAKTEQSCRLPSEAEWEYAARAGSSTVYPWGNKADHNKANYGKDECCEGLAKDKDQWVNTAPVGSFPANDFGLNDMHGNVWEWVQDCYKNNYANVPTNGSAYEEAKCDSRVLRGGSWLNSPNGLRSAVRYYNDPGDRDIDVGFRIFCAPPSTEN